jgi:hypothetical protein
LAGRSNRDGFTSEAIERDLAQFIDDPGLSAPVEANGDQAARLLDDPALLQLRQLCGC